MIVSVAAHVPPQRSRRCQRDSLDKLQLYCGHVERDRSAGGGEHGVALSDASWRAAGRYELEGMSWDLGRSLRREASGDEPACWFLPQSSHLVRTKRVQAVSGAVWESEAAAAATETVVAGGGDSFSAE